MRALVRGGIVQFLKTRKERRARSADLRLYNFVPLTSSNSQEDAGLGEKGRARLLRLKATRIMSGMFGFYFEGRLREGKTRLV